MEIQEQNKAYVVDVLDGHILYFKFKEGNTVSEYSNGLQDCMKIMGRPEVDGIMVVVEDDEMFTEEMQNIWLKTGEFADENNLHKWGVAVPSLSKQVTIEYLVQGGKDGDRDYEHFVSDDEDEVMEWMKS